MSKLSPAYIEEEDLAFINSSNASPMARADPLTGYFSNIDDIRHEEYPQLQETTYLDHAGTTLYARSLVTAISGDLNSNLFGNPHSTSSASQLSTTRIDSIRIQILQLLRADPTHFDVVFVSNATAGIKLIAEAFRDLPRGFSYLYHVDSHTSLVGARELATIGHRCLVSDDVVDGWLSTLKHSSSVLEPPVLFSYPGQSNLSGYRPPWEWCGKIHRLRKNHNQNVYSLYDAAALLPTAEIDLSNVLDAPDFTVLSLYKIFGLPDLGCLVVRKDCSDLFVQRKYFGGGTVNTVVSLGSQWHARDHSSLHSHLEDGTVPFHSIIAAGWALSTHSRLFGSMHNISRHASFLARRLYDGLASLKHSTGLPVCQMFISTPPDFGRSQGPTIAFNLRDAGGNWIGKSEVEKLASVRDIQIRAGGLCNPGGIATHLDLSDVELQTNFRSGQRCGDDNDILNHKPTGVIRASIGAMSNVADVDKFIEFVADFFVEHDLIVRSPPLTPAGTPTTGSFFVQSLSLFPIKSCAAFKIPPGDCWELIDDGLAWDREWCLIQLGTGVVLSQKRYLQMAMIRPFIDVQRRLMVVRCKAESIEINLDSDTGDDYALGMHCASSSQSTIICGDSHGVEVYGSEKIADFFTTAVGVPCTLARRRRPIKSENMSHSSSGSENQTQSMPGYFPEATVAEKLSAGKSLANESPILLISQSSLNELRRKINFSNPTAELVSIDSFRANIVIGQEPCEKETPYAEDAWTHLQIGDNGDTSLLHSFVVTGPCQRCQMVCVDQQSAKRSLEPFSTLAKTRRWNGKVWFGMHLRPQMNRESAREAQSRYIKIGDVVKPQKWTAREQSQQKGSPAHHGWA